jgi:hypothetical protein
MDVLRALPGVTETNYHQLAAKVLCLQDLFVMSLVAMQAILGAENGRKLHTFINTQVREAPRFFLTRVVFVTGIYQPHCSFAGSLIPLMACLSALCLVLGALKFLHVTCCQMLECPPLHFR